jgi:hypothetical protein
MDFASSTHPTKGTSAQAGTPRPKTAHPPPTDQKFPLPESAVSNGTLPSPLRILRAAPAGAVLAYFL